MGTTSTLSTRKHAKFSRQHEKRSHTEQHKSKKHGQEQQTTRTTDSSTTNNTTTTHSHHSVYKVESMELCWMLLAVLRGRIGCMDVLTFSLTHLNACMCSFDTLKCAIIEPIDVTISMRNFALINAISMSIATCFENDDEDEGGHAILNKDETRRIKNFASALEVDDSGESSRSEISTIHSTGRLRIGQESRSGDLSSQHLALQLTSPSAKILIINDLQGLDQPLFRVEGRNAVASLRVRESDSSKTGGYLLILHSI